MSRAEGETDQNAGKKNNKEGHWYVLEMNVDERGGEEGNGAGGDGGGRRLGRVESKRVHAAVAAAKAAARLAHEQATGRAAEDDLGVSEERGVRAEARSRV